jgi:hypothetical protein
MQKQQPATSRTSRTRKHKSRSNIIPFPIRTQPRIEVWSIIYVGQSNDGWIRQTVVLRGKGERDMRHLSQDNNKNFPRPKK